LRGTPAEGALGRCRQSRVHSASPFSVGLAVNAHGYLRFTHDIDLVVQLVPENVESTFQALESIGYRPIVPVEAHEFAEPETRKRWITEKGMTVLSFHSERHRDMPFDFEAEFERSLQGEVLPGLFTSFVSIVCSGFSKRARRKMSDEGHPIEWKLTTWEGSRRAAPSLSLAILA
jgi:hypothetical protein